MRHSFRFRNNLSAPRLARRAVEQLLAGRSAEVIDDAKLAVTELVTNCFRHSQDTSAVELIIDVEPDRVRCEVVDDGLGFAPGAPRERSREGGWGLLIVERIASAWGVNRDDRVHVWFERPIVNDTEKVA